MAFKPMDTSPEGRARRQEEMVALRRRRHDQEAFRGEASQERSVFLVDHPIIEPMGGLTRIKARDERGVFTLVLSGDRSPETVFEPRTSALSRALSDMPTNAETIRAGVPAQVVGVEAKVGWDGKRDPNGPFRAVFVETVAFTIDGEAHAYGHARVREADAVSQPAAQGLSNVVAFPSTKVQADRALGADAQAEPAAQNATFGEDPRFVDRRLRSVDLDITGAARRIDSKDVVFTGQNARGRVDVVLPGARGEGWASGPAGQALQDAWTTSGKVAVTATGFFQSRATTDSDGKATQAWDFVAATVAFESGGIRHTLGAPVGERPEPQKDDLVASVKLPGLKSEASTAGYPAAARCGFSRA